MPAVRPAEVVPEDGSRGADARLLLITPPNSYRTVSYLEAARQRGIAALVASEGRFSLVSEIADGLHIDLQDPEALEQLLAANAAQPFVGVVATDDASVELASRIAEALGLPLERLRLVNADTARTPDSGIQGASRSTYWVGGAITQAARVLRTELLEVAAELLDRPPDSLSLAEGAVVVTCPYCSATYQIVEEPKW